MKARWKPNDGMEAFSFNMPPPSEKWNMKKQTWKNHMKINKEYVFSLAAPFHPLEATFLLKWLNIKNAHIKTEEEATSVVWKSLSTVFQTRKYHNRSKQAAAADEQKSWVFRERGRRNTVYINLEAYNICTPACERIEYS